MLILPHQLTFNDTSMASETVLPHGTAALTGRDLDEKASCLEDALAVHRVMNYDVDGSGYRANYSRRGLTSRPTNDTFSMPRLLCLPWLSGTTLGKISMVVLRKACYLALHIDKANDAEQPCGPAAIGYASTICGNTASTRP